MVQLLALENINSGRGMTADELVLSVLLVVGLAIAVAVTHQRGKRYGLNSLD